MPTTAAAAEALAALIPSIEDYAELAAAADGPQQVAWLYQYHNTLLVAWLTRRLNGDVAAAEDLAQLTWMKVVEKRHTFDPARGSFKGWLYRVARNVLIDQAKRPISERPAGEMGDFDSPAGDVEPEHAAVQADLRAQVLTLLDDLPPSQRECLWRRFFGGMSTAQVAVTMGITEGAAAQLQKRAMKKLRERAAALGWKFPDLADE